MSPSPFSICRAEIGQLKKDNEQLKSQMISAQASPFGPGRIAGGPQPTGSTGQRIQVWRTPSLSWT